MAGGGQSSLRRSAQKSSACSPPVGRRRGRPIDEQAVLRARYMSLETIAPLSDSPIVSLPAIAA
jgi:hypothetical protein